MLGFGRSNEIPVPEYAAVTEPPQTQSPLESIEPAVLETKFPTTPINPSPPAERTASAQASPSSSIDASTPIVFDSQDLNPSPNILPIAAKSVAETALHISSKIPVMNETMAFINIL